MGAQPKRKISKARKGRRRAHNALIKPNLTPCPKCGKKKRPHFECEFCGHYGKVESKRSTSSSKSKKK